MTVNELHEFCRGHKRIFCYGAGRYGRTTFSYPFGDYDEDTVSILYHCGIKKACTVTAGLDFKKDALRIPRNKVLDISGIEFERFMRRLCCLYA